MINIKTKFESDGFVILNEILSSEQLCTLSERCESEVKANVGTRNLLSFDWAKDLAQTLIENESLRTLMPKNSVAVQCNYFSKNIQNNWYVTMHRDLSIPIKNKINSRQWSGWSEKEGVLYAQPPKRVLAEMLAVRLHLEDNNSENGALEVVPGSHKSDKLKIEKRSLGVVSQGGALIMRPLLLHSSTKLKSGKRRGIHFVFGPKNLPNNMQWANAV